MKKHRGYRFGVLLLACIMVFSIWNPLSFATENHPEQDNSDNSRITQEEKVETEAKEDGEKQDENNELPPEQEPEEEKEEDPIVEEEIPEEEQDRDPQKEKEEQKPQTEKEGQKPQQKEEEDFDGSLEGQEPQSEEGIHPEEETQEKELPYEEEIQEEEPSFTYYPSSPNIKVGPIITSLSRPMKAGARMFGLNSIDHEYIEPIEGLELSKTASLVENSEDEHGRGIFRLNLTATSESKLVDKAIPSDIILVLDRSSSMMEVLDEYIVIKNQPNPNSGSYYYVKVDGEYQLLSHQGNDLWRYGGTSYVKWDPSGDDDSPGSLNSSTPVGKPFYLKPLLSKLQGLKDAANNFVRTVHDQSPESRIAVVSFSTNEDNLTNGLVNIDNNGSINSTITDKINGLKAEGGTHPEAGLRGARTIFAGDTTEDRNRVVIMFTDGEPGTSGGMNKVESAKTINQAAVLKGEIGVSVSSAVNFYGEHAGPVNKEAGLGATVYTIGIFPSSINELTHPFMTWVSSEKPYINKNDYEQVPTNTEPNKENGYYFTADSADSLEDIFQKIAVETGKTIRDVVLRDYIDPRFNIVDEESKVIEVGNSFTIDGITGTVGSDSNGIYVEWGDITIEPGEENGFSGSLYIKAKDSFEGGEGIPTNIANISALYSDGKNIGSFPLPTVDVPIINLANSSLTITKIIEGAVNPNQTFVFRIEQYENEEESQPIRTFYETVRIDEGLENSRTIINLPKGYYKVTEKVDWSWQYSNGESSKAIDIDINDNKTINFNNTPKKVSWLTSIDWVVNLFTGGGN